MKTRQQLEAAVIDAVVQILPPGAAKAGLRTESDLRNELGMDSIGLVSLVDLVDEALGVDLSSSAERLADARRVGDLIRLCSDLYFSQTAAAR